MKRLWRRVMETIQVEHGTNEVGRTKFDERKTMTNAIMRRNIELIRPLTGIYEVTI